MKRNSKHGFLAAIIVSGALLAGAMLAHALELKTIEDDLIWNQVYQTYSGGDSFQVDVSSLNMPLHSSWTVTRDVLGFSYAILAVGGNATFTISHTTKTFSTKAGDPSSFNNSYPLGLYKASGVPSLSTSTANIAINNVPLNGVFKARVVNPVFNFSSLTSTATIHIWVDYGVKRVP